MPVGPGFLWEYSCKRLQLAQLLGQLGVFLTPGWVGEGRLRGGDDRIVRHHDRAPVITMTPSWCGAVMVMRS